MKPTLRSHSDDRVTPLLRVGPAGSATAKCAGWGLPFALLAGGLTDPNTWLGSDALWQLLVIVAVSLIAYWCGWSMGQHDELARQRRRRQERRS